MSRIQRAKPDRSIHNISIHNISIHSVSRKACSEGSLGFVKWSALSSRPVTILVKLSIGAAVQLMVQLVVQLDWLISAL
ncbi:MAG: hypothetical protein MH252_18700 [Thermosynechococcaceae cyanobacterium MS004]|nr:hypothetical protein [Thermosynechococcaceae cyanobacterium MS004]